LWEEYKAATGIDYELDDNAIRGNDDNRTIAYVDTSGDEDETKTISITDLANEVAAYRALEALGKSAEEVATTLGALK
jgi:hypothetical protein